MNGLLGWSIELSIEILAISEVKKKWVIFTSLEEAQEMSHYGIDNLVEGNLIVECAPRWCKSENHWTPLVPKFSLIKRRQRKPRQSIKQFIQNPVLCQRDCQMLLLILQYPSVNKNIVFLFPFNKKYILICTCSLPQVKNIHKALNCFRPPEEHLSAFSPWWVISLK